MRGKKETNLRHVYLRQLIGALLLLLVRMHRAHAVADAVLRRVHKRVEARVSQPHVRVLRKHKHSESLLLLSVIILRQ